ncbi:MAG TPA: hydrolase [Cytophagales bacterium]|nr:hydrolase [Cytophagales bacterium]
MLQKHIIVFLCLIGLAETHPTLAQNKPQTPLSIKKAIGAIQIDGVLDEEDWKRAMVAKDFFLKFPVDTALAPFQTEVRLTFDEDNLYVSFVCYDDQTPDIVQSLRRDFDYGSNDNVGLTLGPYNDRINGFFFVVTPRGVQMEGTVSQGGTGEDSFNSTWDNKWYSKVVKYEDRWIAELAIPFKSLRFKSNLREWNINFVRWDIKRNQSSTWVAVPIQYDEGSFAYSGQLVWEDPPPKAGSNISLIPYVAGSSSVDRETTPTNRDQDFQGGLDAKVAVTPSLNLDLTINPDFSQVEVDRQVINLTRFEFRFPERRQFFLENSDLFGNAGFPESRPFFSRRIGLARDSSSNIQKVPIAFGARISGSITKDWRVSAMNMQTREQLSLGLPRQNYTVATIQRNFWKQSNVGITYVDKQSLGLHLRDTMKYFYKDLVKRNERSEAVLNDFNRVLAIDTDLLSIDNKWYMSAFMGKAFDVLRSDHSLAGGLFGRYADRNWEVFLGETFVEENYNSEAGFVPSYGVYPGQFNTFGNIAHRFYPKEKSVVVMSPGVMVTYTHIPDGTITDRNVMFNYDFRFRNTSNLRFGYGMTFQRLTSDFSLIDEDRYTSYLEGETYEWGSLSVSYSSDQRKLINYQLQSSYGGFYNGTNLNINGQLNYRYQPFGSLSIRYDYNDLRLPDNYVQEKLFLLGPRLDLTFTDKLFLTTFVQYNNLADNVNLNARFQWRYQPASDFFIVYTENYLPGTLGSKNRALVFKFTYWLNL